VQFPIGAVLQHSNTPSLRVAGFEDEDDEDSLSNVAFCARWLVVLSASEVGRTKRLTSGAISPVLWFGALIQLSRPNIWCLFQGTWHKTLNPGLRPWAMIRSRFAAKKRHDGKLKSCYRLSPPASRLGFQLCGNGMDRSAFPATCEILVDDATIGGFVQAGRKYRQFGFDFAFVSSGDGSIQSLMLRFDSGEH
jgi:hypothetical protein